VYTRTSGRTCPGFNDEAEANFISVIACTTSHDPLLKYSGWLLVWENLPQDVHLTHAMGKTAYDDIEAIRARYLRNVNKQVESVSRSAYDHYLKSNTSKPVTRAIISSFAG
jgi:hypothetical protein